MAKRYVCSCGHSEHESNIYLVHDWKLEKKLTLCYECWDEAHLIDLPSGQGYKSCWAFADIDDQKLIVK